MANPSRLRLRAAVPGDLDALVALEQRLFRGDRLSRRSFMRALAAPTAALIVAESAAEIVGYGLVHFRARSHRARLYSLAVAPEAAGRGIGRALLQAVEARARASGCAVMRLEVDAGNHRAADLYRRNGYVVFGRHDAYYADGADALRMEKTLPTQ